MVTMCKLVDAQTRSSITVSKSKLLSCNYLRLPLQLLHKARKLVIVDFFGVLYKRHLPPLRASTEGGRILIQVAGQALRTATHRVNVHTSSASTKKQGA